MSVTPLGERDYQSVVKEAQKAGYPTDTARHGVAAYRLTYRTVAPDGSPTTASGLLTLPRGGGHRLPTVVHGHGTLAYRGYAASVADGPDRTVSLLYASAGRAAVSPDYLGLGTGPGPHPYLDNRSAADASLDMLRAAHTAAPKLGRTLDGRVYATGFSQGGQVAMALGRTLNSDADTRFHLRGVAAVGGAYDLDSSQLPGLFDGRVGPGSAVFYTAYFLTAQNRLHHLYSDPRQVFRAPCAEHVEELFDSNHPAEQIAGKLPETLPELLSDQWHTKLQNPSGRLLAVLRSNDFTCDWKPNVPVTLYSASGDHDVPIANSRHCAQRVSAHGGSARVVDEGDVSHYAAFQRSLPEIARSFPTSP
ncbi:alpha/beta hydrolase family protein [Streptomyces sp. CB02923]|uniref:alpha/beta hydrolase family protein n=1 Tax=Streptomyces sp. CB02923 TaxID=1718985 RepID=UPI001901E59F|nr:alpha/beta hydrolase [Streptomyces sp. CB02923]